VDANMRQIH